MLQGLALWLGDRGRKVARLLLILKACGLVAAIAKWLAGGMAAATQSKGRTASQAVWFPVHVTQFNFPFDAQRTVVADCDLYGWHVSSKITPANRKSVNEVRRKCRIVPPDHFQSYFCTSLLQYFGMRGSTSSAQARTPPFRLSNFLKPAVCRK